MFRLNGINYRGKDNWDITLFGKKKLGTVAAQLSACIRLADTNDGLPLCGSQFKLILQ